MFITVLIIFDAGEAAFHRRLPRQRNPNKQALNLLQSYRLFIPCNKRKKCKVK